MNSSGKKYASHSKPGKSQQMGTKRKEGGPADSYSEVIAVLRSIDDKLEDIASGLDAILEAIEDGPGGGNGDDVDRVRGLIDEWVKVLGAEGPQAVVTKLEEKRNAATGLKKRRIEGVLTDVESFLEELKAITDDILKQMSRDGTLQTFETDTTREHDQLFERIDAILS